MTISISALLLIIVSPTMSSDHCRYTTPLARNINDFGFQLARKLDQTGNLMISPYSAYAAIGMVYLGSKHKTSTDIENVLQLRRDGLIGPALKKSFKSLLGDPEGRYTLETANAIFLQHEFPVKEDYVKNLKDFNQASFKHLDFAKSAVAATEEINRWVAEVTHGKIKKMVPILDSSTKLVLLNAVYFKGNWMTPFLKRDTIDYSFHKRGGEIKKIKMLRMLKTPFFPFYEDPNTGFKYLELPYKGYEISMLLVLPRSAEDFPKAPKSSSELCDIFNKLQNEELEIIGIPKFSLKYKKDLKEALAALGIRDLFSGSSDLTGIVESNSLPVSTVLHKAIIDVNEEGSEAAASTFAGMLMSSLPNKNRYVFKFVADHPFLFYIVNKRNGLVLFSGRVTDP